MTDSPSERLDSLLGPLSEGAILRDVPSNAPGPQGALPLTEEMLLDAPSGDIFALSQNVGMGWDPAELNRPQVLILSTQGGIRAPDGTPIALGYHTGQPPRSCAARARCPSPATAPTPAMGAPRVPPACSIACPTATMPRKSSGGSSARCRPATA